MKRVMSMVLVFCMVIGWGIAYGKDGTILRGNKELEQFIKETEIEVTNSFKNSKEFESMVKEYGQDAGVELINEIVQGKVEIYLNNLNKANVNSYQYSVSLPVPLIKQRNGHYCGPATVLQTLYGLQKAKELSAPMPSGTTDVDKQVTLGKNMGTDTSGTIVYRMRNELNKYVDSSKYVYARGEYMSSSNFVTAVNNSLKKKRPVILHAKTEYLPYYKGRESRHYISLDTYTLDADVEPTSTKDFGTNSIRSRTVRLVDPNWRSAYRGFFTVPIEAAHNCVKPSRRYVIYGTN